RAPLLHAPQYVPTAAPNGDPGPRPRPRGSGCAPGDARRAEAAPDDPATLSNPIRQRKPQGRLQLERGSLSRRTARHVRGSERPCAECGRDIDRRRTSTNAGPRKAEANRAGQQGTEWLEIATAADLRAPIATAAAGWRTTSRAARANYATIEYSGSRIGPSVFVSIRCIKAFRMHR